ncbi:hypothetical protein E3P99_03587 [Wallemia hederae]|uniref:SAC domain-containing protein n=1 Tax=Wallemia hederae TaxID=1540922 RepID=A0A4V4LSN1_9BASI|nr:hypothetical protein E3P99_03587 [Wallemia hederae]
MLDKFTLYETKASFIIVGSNQSQDYYKLIKLSKSLDVEIQDDDNVYTLKDVNQLLKLIEIESNGVSKVHNFYGVLGFIKFTKFPYLILVTKRSPVCLLGGHYIYHVDDTLMINMSPKKSFLGGKLESKLLNTFKQVDLSKNFYFSYSYDLTCSLQSNLSSTLPFNLNNFNHRFMWNHHLLTPIFKSRRLPKSSWILPLIHGFVDQSKLIVFGRVIYVTLIARRSRHFAGARYLKRGANDSGEVANEVESEQIVSDTLTTPFTSKSSNYQINPNFTSFLQYRGSIPLSWSQDPQMGIKPMINIAPVDPYYRTAAKHFKNLFERYGAQVFVLNLVKCRERVPRESKLLQSYDECIQHLNQFLDDDNRIRAVSWDMSRASKSNQDVIGFLETFAEHSIQSTGFYQSKNNNRQSGIIRTNCVDCLDRTNAAQFVIGKVAFTYQLHALGIIEKPTLAHDTDAVNMLTEMYHDHGDTIALQYGGSALVNRVETYRKINQWNSHSRDVVENIKRYYANSLLDADKQAAIDLFLGQTSHPTSLEFSSTSIPTKEYFKEGVTQSLVDDDSNQSLTKAEAHLNHDYWQHFYRPRLFTSLERHFSTNMNSTLKYLPRNLKNRKNMSPFHTVKTPPSTPTRPFAPVKRWMSLQSIPSTRRNSSIGTISEVDSFANNEDGKDYESSIDVEEMIKERMQDLGIDQLDLLDAVERTNNPDVGNSEVNVYQHYADYDYMNHEKDALDSYQDQFDDQFSLEDGIEDYYRQYLLSVDN